jgi:hypothetical protein
MMMTVIILILLILIVILITIIHLNSEFIFVLTQQPNDRFSQQKYKREYTNKSRPKVTEDHIFMAKQQE